MDNNKSPAPSRVIGIYAGQPIYIRSYANRVELTFKGINKSFPTREAALFYLQALYRKNRKGGKL